MALSFHCVNTERFSVVKPHQNEKNITLISAYLVRNPSLIVTKAALIFVFFTVCGLVSQYIERGIQYS